MKGFFVTGTDTGVGKTFVAAALVRRARALGQRVFAFKPIESGCDQELGVDQTLLCEAAGGWQTGFLRGVYQLQAALAPLPAAERQGTNLDINLILKTLQAGASQCDLTIVEGVGGWRVPITESVDVAAVAARVGLPIVIVGRTTLGTINHSLLTLESIERSGTLIAGLVLSHRPAEDRDLALNNVEQIQRRWRGLVTLFEGEASELDPLLERST